MKITKKHIGTTVWLVPEGNEVRRGAKGGALAQAREGTVISMARTRGAIRVKGYVVDFTVIDHWQGADRISTMFNGGYQVFAEYAEIERMIEASPLRQKIERALYHLPADKILAMADIAGVR